MRKILIIGNSHSVDAFHFLHDAFSDQMPDEEVTLGILYYSGCSIDKHIGFYKDNDPACDYYKNTDGEWSISKKTALLKAVLEDEPWDIVFLQAAKVDLDDTLNLDGRRELEAIVNEHLKNPHGFGWHTSWPCPNDPYFFAEGRFVPNGYKENLERLYGFDPFNQFAVLTGKARKHILADDTYTKKICSGAGVMNAYAVQGVPQTEIWRDYTHLNEFGRLIAAYTWYVQLTGNKIEKIGIDTIPAHKRHKYFTELGDMTVTDDMKQVIIAAANQSIDNTWYDYNKERK